MSMKLRERWVWEGTEAEFYASKCVGYTIHVCSGSSPVGDLRVDRWNGDRPLPLFPDLAGADEIPRHVDIRADYRHLPFKDGSADTVLCDPPWGKIEDCKLGLMNWLAETRRVARQRIIIIHNSIFMVRGWDLVEAWAVCPGGGFLWKSMSVYAPGDLTL